MKILTHTHTAINKFASKAISFIAFLVVACSCLISSLNAQPADPVVTTYQAIIYYSGGSVPSAFMNETNQSIINHVKNLGCNTIFFYASTKNAVPNEIDLGLNPYPGYLDKVVNFLDMCANQGLKVFAFTLDEAQYVLTPNHPAAINKLNKICYYQTHVRISQVYNGSNPPYPDYRAKKAHFHGVVTNLEPWIGSLTGWEEAICNTASRTINNDILEQYLDLIPQLYDKLATENFFSPSVESGYTVQTLDGKFMGTVQWLWHYFAQTTTNFPNGDFSLYVGIRNGNHYFDILMPETYCGQGTNCINKPCVDPTITVLCGGKDISYDNDESVGRCYQWFDKHYITGTIAPTMTVKPIDAAPMLYGHSAYMFDQFAQLNYTRWSSKEFTLTCKSKNNYKGSFIYDYAQSLVIPRGMDYISNNLCGNAIPDDDAGLSIRRVISIYPNPANDELSIEGLLEGDRVQVYDYSMNLVTQSEQRIFSVSNLPEGFYVIHVLSIEGEIVVRQSISIKH